MISSDPVIPDLDTRRLADLIFELARQLHVERAERLALEVLLIRSGIIDAQDIVQLANDESFAKQTKQAVEASIAHIMDIVTEPSNPRRPLCRTLRNKNEN